MRKCERKRAMTDVHCQSDLRKVEEVVGKVMKMIAVVVTHIGDTLMLDLTMTTTSSWQGREGRSCYGYLSMMMKRVDMHWLSGVN